MQPFFAPNELESTLYKERLVAAAAIASTQGSVANILARPYYPNVTPNIPNLPTVVDFEHGTYSSDLAGYTALAEQSSILNYFLSTVRGTPGMSWGANGSWNSVAVNTSRITYDPITRRPEGLLVEGVGTNFAKNSGLQGAVAGIVGSGGAFPTAWTANAQTALTAVPVVTISNITANSLDVRFSGTLGGSSGTLSLNDYLLAAPALVSGNVVFASTYLQLVGGTTANVLGFKDNLSEYTSAMSYVGQASNNQVITSAIQSDIPFPLQCSKVIATATGARIIHQLTLSFTTGQPIDMTFRIYTPMLEVMTAAPGFPTSPYPENAATVTTSSATPCVVSWAAHGLPAGTPVFFQTTGALYTGLTANTVVYVSTTGLVAGAFQVADTQAHALAGTNSIATSGSQSGVQTCVAGIRSADDCTIANAAAYVGAGEFSFAIEGRASQGCDTGTLFEISDGTADNRITLRVAAHILYLSSVIATVATDKALGLWLPMTRGRVAVAVSATEVRASFNGKPVVSTATAPATNFTKAVFGNGAAGYWNGTIAYWAHYTTSLASTQLKAASLGGNVFLYDDFDRPNGGAGKAPTGQIYAQAPAAGGAVVAAIASKILTATDSGGALTAAYTGVDTGNSMPFMMAAAATFSAGTSGGSAALVSNPNGVMTAAEVLLLSIHNTFTNLNTSLNIYTASAGAGVTINSLVAATQDGSTQYYVLWMYANGGMVVRTQEGLLARDAVQPWAARGGRYMIYENYWGTGATQINFPAVYGELQ